MKLQRWTQTFIALTERPLKAAASVSCTDQFSSKSSACDVFLKNGLTLSAAAALPGSGLTGAGLGLHRSCPGLPRRFIPIYDHMGEVRELNPGDWLYPHVQVRSYMLVEAGLTGRIVATVDGQSGAGAMALSTPMRNAAGNLNWLTHRSAIGRYQALSHVRLREIPHSEALAFLMQADKDFYLALYAQMELINLSDRFGFAILALLPAIDRFKALLIAWSLFYGEVSEGPRGLRIRVPIPGRKNHIAQVIRTSSVTLDGILRELKTAENWEREGDFVTFNASTLQSVHEWMRHAEGKDAYLARPARVEDMLLAAQAEVAEIIH